MVLINFPTVFCVLGIFTLHQFVNGAHPGGSPGAIPSKDEQQLVLSNVQEILEHAKEMVKEENIETDVAVVNDVRKIVKRAQDKLSIVEEMTLIKMSISHGGDKNFVLQETSRGDIQKITQEGYNLLEQCTRAADSDIRESSAQVTGATSSATEYGQTILNTLLECSKKNTLQQIVCYKRVMGQDVEPLKVRLVESMENHKKGHARNIEIRNEANYCVDDILEIYQIKLAQILADEVSALVMNV